MDNSADRRRAAQPAWEAQTLFDTAPYLREKASMQVRLAALGRALQEAHGGHECPHCQKTVDNFKKFLDEWIRSRA